MISSCFYPFGKAVGTQVTLHPPHRSQRALLTHWAPASGCDVQLQIGIRMHNSHPSITFCCLSYPFQRFWQAEQVKLTISGRPSQHANALGPFEFRHSHLFPGSAPGACLARSDSPWPDPFPPPPPLTGVTPAFVRRSPRYYGSVRLPTSVRRSRTPLGFTARTLSPPGQTWDLPVPVRKASVHAWGLRPRGAETHLALAMYSVLPSVHVDDVGTPKQTPFRGSIPSLHVPLSTLRATTLRGCTHDSGPM